VTRGLSACGFELDHNGVLASEALWRMSTERWEQTFRDCLDSPDRSHLIRANVSFDFRQITGALDVTPPLVAVLRGAPGHPDLLRRLGRAAADFKPPLGFRGSLVVKGGDSPGIDLKQGGTIPIANLARFHALSNGITISATFDRLTAVAEVGKLDGETAAMFFSELLKRHAPIPIIGTNVTLEPAWLAAVSQSIGPTILAKSFVAVQPYAAPQGRAWEIFDDALLIAASDAPPGA